MMGFGLLSVVVAAFFLPRQKDVKRLFAYSSIEHMGLTTFAFGMGGPLGYARMAAGAARVGPVGAAAATVPAMSAQQMADTYGFR